MSNANDWKEYKFEFNAKSKPEIKSITVVFSVTGTIYLDDAYFAPLPEEER